MKQTKKFAALLLAVLMIALMGMPANAMDYAAVSPNVTVTGFGLKETLAVNGPNTTFNPALGYTLTLGTITAYNDGTSAYGDVSTVTGADAVNGQTFAAVSFAEKDVTGGSNKTNDYDVTAAIVAAINSLSFDRPGIYYWEITKTLTGGTGASNHNRNTANKGTALVIRVDDNGGGILVPTVSVNDLNDAGLPAGKGTAYSDFYPANTGTLIVKKEVAGNQGAKDQYFKFTVELTGLAANGTVPIDTTAGPGAAGPGKYGEACIVNPTSVTADASGNASVDFWLKHGERVEFKDLPDGANYTVTEDTPADYDPEWIVEESGTKVAEGTNQTTGPKVFDAAKGARVVFENKKESAVPTGILLETAAPIAGLLSVGGLFSALALTKRKKNRFGTAD